VGGEERGTGMVSSTAARGSSFGATKPGRSQRRVSNTLGKLRAPIHRHDVRLSPAVTPAAVAAAVGAGVRMVIFKGILEGRDER
jgi:hypothetical protein